MKNCDNKCADNIQNRKYSYPKIGNFKIHSYHTFYKLYVTVLVTRHSNHNVIGPVLHINIKSGRQLHIVFFAGVRENIE